MPCRLLVNPGRLLKSATKQGNCALNSTTLYSILLWLLHMGVVMCLFCPCRHHPLPHVCLCSTDPATYYIIFNTMVQHDRYAKAGLSMALTQLRNMAIQTA